MPRKGGVRKFFSKPKKGYRKYGSMKNWRYKNTKHLSSNDLDVTTTPDEENFMTAVTEKPRVKVLSLFDGIAAGLLTLSNVLSLDVEAYFSSEILLDALKVQRYNFEDNLTPVGDVTHLTRERLHQFGPIHLLLGASPCSNLSRVNPNRKGLYDPAEDGILFFEFLRIRDFFIEDSERKGYSFYWLFENTSCLDIFTKDELERYLQSSPIKRIPSCSDRTRLFWGNLPDFQENNMTVRDPKGHYQQFLQKPRVALLDVLPTITTNPRSQFGDRGTAAPVSDCGVPDGLFITELETQMGYPIHFTDVARLSTSQRWVLLGRAWEVHLIVDILKPLQTLFKIKDLGNKEAHCLHCKCPSKCIN